MVLPAQVHYDSVSHFQKFQFSFRNGVASRQDDTIGIEMIFEYLQSASFVNLQQICKSANVLTYTYLQQGMLGKSGNKRKHLFIVCFIIVKCYIQHCFMIDIQYIYLL